MLRKNFSIGLFLLMAAGVVAIGCNQTQETTQETSETATTVAAKIKTEADCCSDEKAGNCVECAQAALDAKQEEGCGDCPACAGNETAKCKCEESTDANAKPATTGCCGKCAAESNQQVAKKTEGCGDCDACADGDSSDCKCSGGSDETTKTDKESKSAPASNFVNDRDVFHFLLSNKDKITRKVTETKQGVITVTESADADITGKIQEHVASMYQRVENVQPIRMRDPLYREIFKHTDKIEMKLENTDNGIRVTETSDDEYVVKLIQAHAKVVSGFVEHGFEEAHKNHEPPKRSAE